PSGQRPCGSSCIAFAACCSASECAAVSGEVCDAGACACPGRQRPCGNTCIPFAACCSASECSAVGSEVCDAGACTCPSGPSACCVNGDCTSPPACKQLPATCTAATGACSYASQSDGSGCGDGRECTGGVCGDIFHYAPSNFVPTAVGTPSAGISFAANTCG